MAVTETPNQSPEPTAVGAVSSGDWLGVMTRSALIQKSVFLAGRAFRWLAAIGMLLVLYILTAPIGLKLTEHMSTWPTFYRPVLWIWKPLRPFCEWYFNDIWHVGFWPNW